MTPPSYDAIAQNVRGKIAEALDAMNADEQMREAATAALEKAIDDGRAMYAKLLFPGAFKKR